MSSFPQVTQTFHHDVYPAISPSNPALCASGKVILVSGGGKGIGRAIATSFASAGAKAIVVTGRDESSLAQTAEEIRKTAGGADCEVQFFVADVTDEKAIADAFSQATNRHGTIDVVVQNAGYLHTPTPLATSPLADWWRGFETNVRGAVIVTRAFLDVAKPGATLINIASAASFLNVPGFTGYAASKLAMARVAELVQLEQPGLRVFNVQPGLVESDMSKKSGFRTADSPGKADNVVPCAQERNDADCQVVELPAAFCVWLATPEADFLKGRFLFANWDVEELKAMAHKFEDRDLLTIGLKGWP